MHGAKNFPLNKMKSNLDIELPDGCDDQVYLGKLSENLEISWKESQPDIVYYLAGVDIHEVLLYFNFFLYLFVSKYCQKFEEFNKQSTLKKL